MTIVPIILAAGEGKRMRSEIAKVLQPVLGVPMIKRVMDAASIPGAEKPVVVVGHRKEQVIAELGDAARYAVQEQRLGTGHAVLMAKDYLVGKKGYALILAGDMPLLKKETILALAEAAQGRALALLSAELEDPTGYGRILRDGDGNLLGIVEHKDATHEQQNIHEVNASVYCFDIEILLSSLDRLKNDNAQGEYYLTDCVEDVVKAGFKATALRCEDPAECMGANDPAQLAECERLLKLRA
ncbi:MAG: NTP transferase domain-containing protein [Christensenellales bacterium]|jgi:bifunctional UDP-N-acetylglucosamine pyrophosphorylase/glucosamine-1-phosphate N-acetyltransferase